MMGEVHISTFKLHARLIFNVITNPVNKHILVETR